MIDELLPDALDGERIDRVVAMLDGCSRSAAATMIAEGGVVLDGDVVTQRSHRVHAGDRIVFEPTTTEVTVVEADPRIDFEVVHVDDDVIIVNKPAGLVVHPGAGRPDATLVNGLLARFPEIAEVGDPSRPGIVHRLDADTSGLLAVARSDRAYEGLVSMLADHLVDRIYIAVVLGSVTDERGVIDAPIGRSSQRRTRMAVVADGRTARTHYEVVARDHDEPAITQLECRLETGRTHQIRVHLSAIGHPVLGDPTYGNAASRNGFTRVALHAAQLGFVHPVSGEQVEFHAPLPADLAEFIATRFT